MRRYTAALRHCRLLTAVHAGGPRESRRHQARSGSHGAGSDSLVALAALENVALWHERDISHSSVERVIGPDSTTLLDFALVRMTRLIDGMVVYPENMAKNMALTGGLYFSQRFLLALIDKGLDRQDAYVLVQRNAMPVWEEGKDFKEMLLADKDVRAHLSAEEIETHFDLRVHLRHIDTLFKRVFGDETA